MLFSTFDEFEQEAGSGDRGMLKEAITRVDDMKKAIKEGGKTWSRYWDFWHDCCLYDTFEIRETSRWGQQALGNCEEKSNTKTC